MSVSIPRQSEALFQTFTRILNHFGQDNCVILTLTLKKERNVNVLRKRMRRLQKLLEPHTGHIFSVFGVSPNAAHVHALAVIQKDSDLSAFSRHVKRLKAKAGFSHRFSVEKIRHPEAACRYLAGNYSSTARYLAILPTGKSGKLYTYRGIPKGLRVKGRDFSRNTPDAKAFRASMNRLAGLCSTEIGNYDGLESRTFQSPATIRKIIFGLLSRIPCGERGLSAQALMTAFPALRPPPADEGEGEDFESQTESSMLATDLQPARFV